jgi:parvulin-like peptidyl-prolyl isomerase
MKLLLIILTLNLNAKEILIDNIKAVVNNSIITSSDLKKSKKIYKDLDNNQILEKLINEKLIMHYLKENQQEINDKEIIDFIENKRKNLGISKTAFLEQLKQSGQTFEEFKKNLKLQKAKAKIFELELKKKINTSDEDIIQEFEKKTKENANIKSYKIRHILVLDYKKAIEIKNKLKNKANFKSLALNYSLDKGTSKNGGLLGFVTKADIMPEIYKNIKDKKENEIVGPVKTKLGYHIIKVDKINKTINPLFKEKKQEIEHVLVEKKLTDLLKKWLSEIRKESYVKVFK